MKLLYFHSARITSQMANLNQVVQMCNAFAENGVEVHLSLSGDNLPSETVLESLGEIYGEINFSLSVRKTILSRMADNYLFAGSIKRAIAQIKPDLIFCRNHLYLKPCINSGVPVLYESHDANLHLRLNWLDKHYKTYIRKTARSNHRFLMITISNALKHFWMDVGVPKEKIIALHDGFDAAMFKNKLSQNEARTFLKLAPEKTIATYTGSLYPNREIDNILLLAEYFPQVLFVVVGGPNQQKAHYEKLAANKGLTNVQFTGRVAHKTIPLYLYASDVLLALWSSKVRTINYCSPLKVFEYMASGQPIIAQGFPTIKEVLKNQVSAIVAEPDSIEDLKHSMQTFLQNGQHDRMGKTARREAFQNYSWGNRTKSILSYAHKMFNLTYIK